MTKKSQNNKSNRNIHDSFVKKALSNKTINSQVKLLSDFH